MPALKEMRAVRVVTFLVAAFASASQSSAQTTLLWTDQVGAAGHDITFDVARSPAAIYAVGRFSGTVDFDPGMGSSTLTSLGTDAFVQKLDVNRNFGWVARIGGPGAVVHPYQAAADVAGNVTIVGTFTGTIDVDPGSGITNVTANGSFDAFRIKLSSTGALLEWQTVGQGFTGLDAANAVAAAGSSVYWAGSVYKGPAGANHDAFIHKVAGAGSWTAEFIASANSAVVPYGLSTDQAGNLFVVGFLRGTADLDPSATTSFLLTSTPDGTSSSLDAFVCKLSSSGAFLWARKLGAAGDDRGFGVAVDGSGSVYVGGLFDGTVDFDPAPLSNYPLTGSGNSRTFVWKLDSAGNFRWARKLGGAPVPSPDRWPHELAMDGNGFLLVAGSFTGTADFDPRPTVTRNLTSAGLEDAFVAKLDLMGNLVFAVRFGDTGSDHAFGCAGAGQDFLLAGQFAGTVDFDPGPGVGNLVSAGLFDGFLIYLRQAGSGEVPDGRFIPFAQMRVSKSGSSSIALQWDPSCPSDIDFEIYEGDLGAFEGHEPVICSTGGLLNATITPGPGNHYYLVVPTSGAFEGFYGKDSEGVERVPSASACLPQVRFCESPDGAISAGVPR